MRAPVDAVFCCNQRQLLMHKKTGKEMEIIGKLKENVEKAETKEEAKEIIRNAGVEAGMELSEEELDKAAGGVGVIW